MVRLADYSPSNLFTRRTWCPDWQRRFGSPGTCLGTPRGRWRTYGAMHVALAENLDFALVTTDARLSGANRTSLCHNGRATVHVSAVDGNTPASIGQPKVVVPGCDDVVMTSTASSGAVAVRPDERLEVLFEELSELAGQRNAIDGRIVEIAAEIDRDELCGATGARSVAALMAWKTGSSSANAHTIAAVARRWTEFPLRPGVAGGPAVTGSGRRDRRAGR